MKKKLVLATRNRHKIEELQQMLRELDIEILSLDDVPNLPEVEEDGDTFAANAAKKARMIAAHTGWASLADDSGLVVDALGGQPGVYSARFAGAAADDFKNNQKLLEMMRGYEDDERRARFVCVIAISDPSGQVVTVEGKCEGKIGQTEQGSGGFGYDPLFIPQGYDKTFAQLSSQEKNRISHRGQALLKAKAELLRGNLV